MQLKSGIITGLPDAYGRGQQTIVSNFYGNRLMEEKPKDYKQHRLGDVMTNDI